MWLDPIKSLVSFRFYLRVTGKSLWATAGYIAYLGLFYALSLALAVVLHIYPKIDAGVRWLSESIPEIALRDGKLHSASKEPALIRHPSLPDLGIVIDTERVSAPTADEMARDSLFLYVTSDAVVLWVPLLNRLETYEASTFPSEKEVVVGPEFYALNGKILKRMLWLVLPFAWNYFVIWKLIAALIYSLVAMLVNAFQAGGLKFGALYRLSVYAQTPWIAVQMIEHITNASLPVSWSVVLAPALTGVYLWKAISLHKPGSTDPEVL